MHRILWHAAAINLLLGLNLALSMPHYILTSSVAKCFQVDVPSQTTIAVAYSTPDLGLSNDAVETTKRTVSRSMSLLIVHKVNPGGTHRTSQHNRSPAKAPTGRFREQITKRDGVIEYTTGAHEGPVEICAQAASASKRTPVRFAIRVIQDAIETSGHKLVLQKLAQGQVIRSGAEKLTEHSSRLTEELSRLLKHINQIANTAETMKEREKSLHDRSISLQRAVKLWPIIRMFVLVSAAYMQTHYVVSFMKRRHIV
ncbi:hypothetical protein MPSEU_000498200 [Mayamaea pseudoterrestris]|nr:hypothetical protein MPSEU_000498200 [Mayamaea pseudoterrestris]